MALGSSRPWPDALEAITGVRDMTAEPLVEFFSVKWNGRETVHYLKRRPRRSLGHLFK